MGNIASRIVNTINDQKIILSKLRDHLAIDEFLYETDAADDMDNSREFYNQRITEYNAACTDALLAVARAAGIDASDSLAHYTNRIAPAHIWQHLRETFDAEMSARERNSDELWLSIFSHVDWANASQHD
ncbi:hypothetical protein HLH33_18695 [Gluconacetobacter diazotrophicus]|uniref:Uncharacterized protein n=1 Tax=Gluconacetobacter diazotrophicus TaxID=33996 RepID=A0A7W4NID2_GLUDI|nr:hypothetical protein [Gluconacetobacter diazotrophicus]MBB2158294.1 hypothetical protein [Gluconacetobacter diazotrophicus]